MVFLVLLKGIKTLGKVSNTYMFIRSLCLPCLLWGWWAGRRDSSFRYELTDESLEYVSGNPINLRRASVENPRQWYKVCDQKLLATRPCVHSSCDCIVGNWYFIGGENHQASTSR